MTRQHRQLRRRKEKTNSSFWVNLLWFILCCRGSGEHIGDAIDRLPDAGDLGDSIVGAMGGAVDKIPDFDIGGTIDNLKDWIPKFNFKGLIDRINTRFRF